MVEFTQVMSRRRWEEAHPSPTVAERVARVRDVLGAVERHWATGVPLEWLREIGVECAPDVVVGGPPRPGGSG